MSGMSPWVLLFVTSQSKNAPSILDLACWTKAGHPMGHSSVTLISSIVTSMNLRRDPTSSRETCFTENGDTEDLSIPRTLLTKVDLPLALGPSTARVNSPMFDSRFACLYQSTIAANG